MSLSKPVRPRAGYRLRKFARKYRTPLRVAGASGAAGPGRGRQHLASHPRHGGRAGGPEPQARGRRRPDAAESGGTSWRLLNENLRRASYVADMNLARVAWDENNLSRAHELLEKHRPLPGETDLRGFEWHYLRRLFHRDLLTVRAHPGRVDAVAFTPDGKRLVTSGYGPPTAEVLERRLGDVKLWDAATGQPLRLDRSWPCRQSGPSGPQPRRHPSRRDSFNHAILVWDLATGGLVTLDGHQNADRTQYAFQSRRQATGLDVPSRDDPRSTTHRVRSGSGTWPGARPS